MSIYRMRRTAVVAMTLVLVFTGISNSQAGWSAARTLMSTTSFGLSQTTATAVGTNGDAVAAWLDEASGKAYAAVRRAGVWGTQKSVCSLSTDGTEQISDVRVAMGGDGTALAAVVFSHVVPRPLPSYTVVKAAVMPLGSNAWTKAVEVSAQNVARSSALGALGADANGNALLLWSDAGTVMNASRPAGGAWSAPQAVAGCPRIGDFYMNSLGEAIVMWSEATGSGSTLRSIKRPAGSNWLSPADIVTLGETAYSPHVAIDGLGLAATTWMSATGSVYNGWLIREMSNGVWNTATTLNDPASSVLSAVDLAMDDMGDLAVVWAEQNTINSEYYIHGQIYPVSGTCNDRKWKTTSASPGLVAPPSVALSPDGSLTAIAWIDDGAASTYAATGTPAQPWSAARMLGAGLYQNAVALACGSESTACSAWPAPTATEFSIKFYASTFKSVPLKLTIADVGNSVAWATNDSSGLILEEVSTLSSTNWTPVTNNIVITNGDFSVIIEENNGPSRFFRLRY